MRRIKYAILTLGLLAFGLALFSPFVTLVSAAVQCPDGSFVVPPATCPTSKPDPKPATASPLTDACNGVSTALCTQAASGDQLPTIAKTITNTLLYVLGAVSVIVIIIAGIMYTTSSGDAALITKAKNTLLYAVVGLVVAIMAYAIVNYVITQFK